MEKQKEMVKMVAEQIGGKGGGKPDSAMGGGTDVSKLDEALSSFLPLVKKTLG